MFGFNFSDLQNYLHMCAYIDINHHLKLLKKKKEKKQTWELRTGETKVGWEAVRQFGRKVDSKERGKEIFSSDNAEQP